MKILVTSDTHGLYNDVSNYILNNYDIDLILHAGDSTSDAKSIEYETDKKCICVRGNNDFFDYVNKDQELIDIGKIRILLTHGHKENVYSNFEKLLLKAQKYEANVVIFGHTHVYFNKKYNDILLLNPGSPSLPRDGNPCFLILNIDDEVKIERINV